jgi:alpha-L-fucosidase
MSLLGIRSTPQPAPTDPETARPTAWFREAKYGLLITWGLYSLPAGEWNGKTYPGTGEWLMNTARIPVADYASLAGRFNPVKFDAEAWVILAMRAGMKYAVCWPTSSGYVLTRARQPAARFDIRPPGPVS